MSGTPLRRIDLIVAAVAGLAVGIAVVPGLSYVLPGHAAGSLLPFEGGLAAGLLMALGIAASKRPALWVPFRQFALACVVAAVTLAIVWKVDLDMSGKARPMTRTHFKHWIPGIAGAGFALWVGTFVAERWSRRRIPALTAVLFGLAIACVSLQGGKYQYDAFMGERVRAWNVYHYYVGSKYFGELSYFDLYAATLSADDDYIERRTKRGKRIHDHFSLIKKARDQRDYKNKPRAEIVEGFDRSVISEQRLLELGRDSRFIGKYMGFRSPGWHQTFKDLGYNPAPAWTLVGTPLSNVVPAKFPQFLIITNSDVPLYLATFLLLWWAFGLRIASVMALWLCSAQLNEARFTGGFLQYDWMCTTLSAIALYHRGWFKSAGVVLSWAAMTRVFPGFLVFGLILQAAIALARTRKLSGIKPAHMTFLLAFTLSCAGMFGASHLTGRGTQTWLEWGDKITRHSSLHAVTSNMRIGVGRLVIHQPRGKRYWSEVRGGKREKLAKTHDRKRKYQAFGGLLLLLALIRRKDLDAMILMLFLPFLLVVTSRYYASVWALLFVLGSAPRGSPDEGKISVAALVAGGVLLLDNATYYYWDRTTTSYFVINYVMYTLFCSLCAAYIASDLRAWWVGRRAVPEPEPVA
ncbi:MAG: hypothetical protein GY898_11740 [Proteobacteria bacterium]|nr:hypothetical protein [Pseudomonadota bacterium]